MPACSWFIIIPKIHEEIPQESRFKISVKEEHVPDEDSDGDLYENKQQ